MPSTSCPLGVSTSTTKKPDSGPVAMQTFALGHFFQSFLICAASIVLPQLVPPLFLAALCDFLVPGGDGKTSHPSLAYRRAASRQVSSSPCLGPPLAARRG